MGRTHAARHASARRDNGQLGGRPPSREASAGAAAAQVRRPSRIDQCLGRGTGDAHLFAPFFTQLNPQGGGTRREQEADSLIAGVEGRPLVFRVMMRQAQAQAQEAGEVCRKFLRISYAADSCALPRASRHPGDRGVCAGHRRGSERMTAVATAMETLRWKLVATTRGIVG